MAEPSSTGNGVLNGLPAWVRILGWMGFPTALAVFLLAQGAGFIGSPSAVTAHVLQEQHAQVLKLVESQDLSMREHRIRQEDLIRLLAQGFKVMCENNAHSVSERNNCATIQNAARYISP